MGAAGGDRDTHPEDSRPLAASVTGMDKPNMNRFKFDLTDGQVPVTDRRVTEVRPRS